MPYVDLTASEITYRFWVNHAAAIPPIRFSSERIRWLLRKDQETRMFSERCRFGYPLWSCSTTECTKNRFLYIIVRNIVKKGRMLGVDGNDQTGCQQLIKYFLSPGTKWLTKYIKKQVAQWATIAHLGERHLFSTIQGRMLKTNMLKGR